MTTLEAGQAYLSCYGWHSVPIPHKSKAPMLTGWQDLRLTEEDLPQHFNGKPQNIGVLLGEASGDLVDVDLDCAEALRLASHFLSASLTFGRKSKPCSHWLYTVPTALPPTTKYQIHHTDERGKRTSETLVELRSTGGQTVFPPSTHPSGEAVAFTAKRDVQHVDGNELDEAVKRLAVACLFLRSWPRAPGTRQDCAQALAGALVRSGFSEGEAERFIYAVCVCAGDEEAETRPKTAEYAATRLASGGRAWGWPKVAELFGEETADVARDWLGVRDNSDDWRRALDEARVLEERPFALPGVMVSDVEREKVRWLWHPRLALGKLTIVDGDPGLGKSLLYLDLAARITQGGTWPDGTPIHEPGNVVIVTMEDGVGDTIRGRLEEAGANVRRVRVIGLIAEADGPGRVPTLPDDTELIMRTAEADGARLVVIDPLFAHLGAKTNSFRDQDVRRALAPLSEAAERAGVAVLVIRHLNKSGGGRAMYRGGGSIGIIGAARIGLLVGEDPDSEGLLVLASTKNNLAAKPDSLAFRVVSSENDPAVAVIRWEGTSTLTADELCRAPAGPSKLDDAEHWLEDYLATGPEPSTEIFERGEEEGYSKNTLYRAKKNLDIEAKKLDFDGGWEWKLPTPPESRLTQDELKALIPEFEHLRESSAGGDGADSSELTVSSLIDEEDPWANEDPLGV